MAKKIELFTPSERTRRNARMGAVIGRCLGFGLLAAPVCLVAGFCAVREGWNGVDQDPDPDMFATPLFKHSTEVARLQREKRLKGGIGDD